MRVTIAANPHALFATLKRSKPPCATTIATRGAPATANPRLSRKSRKASLSFVIRAEGKPTLLRLWVAYARSAPVIIICWADSMLNPICKRLHPQFLEAMRLYDVTHVNPDVRIHYLLEGAEDFMEIHGITSRKPEDVVQQYLKLKGE